MVYKYCTISKVYTGKDNRKRVIIKLLDDSYTTMSYPKYLMEVHLGRYLKPNETVDHIDCDVTNNDISNLRVLDRSLHASIDVKRLSPMTFNCPICNKSFTLFGSKLSYALSNSKRGKFGPFCSRKCAGFYGSEVQNNRLDKKEAKLIEPKYTTLKNQFEP